MRLWAASANRLVLVPVLLGMFLYFLEFMIQCIQAYVFALLLAVYLQGAVSEGH